MTATQYRLYEMTEPYVALFCHPKSELKMPQPPEPFSSGEPNYHPVSSCKDMHKGTPLTFTCHTLFLIS